MKKILFLTCLIVISACSQKSPESIQKKINSYKSQINKLNQKISELETILLEDTSFIVSDQRTRVVLTELGHEKFTHYITVSGTVEAEQEAFVSPELNGQVRKIHIQEGQYVKRGDLLITLRTDITERTIQEVKTSLELASLLYEKQKELWDQKIGSEIQYLQARTNKESLEARLSTLEEQMRLASITAPFDGLVDNIMIKEGELATPGIRLLHLINLKRLKIYSDISESYLNDVQVGEMVELDFPSFPELARSIPVTYIGSVIDNKSRTFRIEVRFNNSDEKVKPNQYVNLKINDFRSDSTLVIPSIVIKQDMQGHFVFIAEGKENEMKAKKIYITPGRSYMENTMVTDGLLPGQKLIVTGYNLVKNGTDIKI